MSVSSKSQSVSVCETQSTTQFAGVFGHWNLADVTEMQQPVKVHANNTARMQPSDSRSTVDDMVSACRSSASLRLKVIVEVSGLRREWVSF